MLILIRLLYFPFFLIVGNGLAIYVVAEGYSKGWLVLLLLSFIVLSLVAERLVPYDKAFNVARNDRWRDVLHAVVNEALSVSGLILLPLLGGTFTLFAIWPDQLPLALQAILAILIADIGITLAHFASHRLTSLWRLHAVHHSIKRMYGFNGLMKHPLHQSIETLAGSAPLLIIGAPIDVLVLLVVAVVLQLLLQHSNVAYFTGPLKKIFVVNVVHRFHHLNSAEEGDVNFGLFTTFTDRLLGTAYYDPDRTIGVNDMGIGTEPNYPSDYGRQLLQPFRSYS